MVETIDPNFEESTPGSLLRESLQREHEHWARFLDPAIANTRNAEYRGRYIHGPNFNLVNDVLRHVQLDLEAVRPNLDPQVLQQFNYQTDDAQIRSLRLSQGELEKLNAVAQNKKVLLDTAIAQVMPEMRAQVVPPGLFDVPSYVQQASGVHLSLGASFGMVFNEITGQKIDQSALHASVKRAYARSMVDDEAYLKIFQSREFWDRYQTDVKVVDVSGADLEYLAKTVAGFKARVPDISVYGLVSLLSKSKHSAQGEDLWQTAVLLSANQNSVAVHDPAYFHGHANTYIPKEEFIKRWGGTYFGAHIIVAKKTI